MKLFMNYDLTKVQQVELKGLAVTLSKHRDGYYVVENHKKQSQSVYKYESAVVIFDQSLSFMESDIANG